MGYILYITRAESRRNNLKSPIRQDEWDSVVAADADLELSTQDHYDREVNGKIERHYLVIWKHQVPFLLIDGAIEITNPDNATIKKMVALARLLNAKVIGEEDEEYGSDGEPVPRDLPGGTI